jgi:hypothetical protein
MARDETTSSERPERRRGRRSGGAPVKVASEPLVQALRISDKGIFASIVEPLERAFPADMRQRISAALSRTTSEATEPKGAHREAAEHALLEGVLEPETGARRTEHESRDLIVSPSPDDKRNGREAEPSFTKKSYLSEDRHCRPRRAGTADNLFAGRVVDRLAFRQGAPDGTHSVAAIGMASFSWTGASLWAAAVAILIWGLSSWTVQAARRAWCWASMSGA